MTHIVAQVLDLAAELGTHCGLPTAESCRHLRVSIVAETDHSLEPVTPSDWDRRDLIPEDRDNPWDDRTPILVDSYADTVVRLGV